MRMRGGAAHRACPMAVRRRRQLRGWTRRAPDSSGAARRPCTRHARKATLAAWRRVARFREREGPRSALPPGLVHDERRCDHGLPGVSDERDHRVELLGITPVFRTWSATLIEWGHSCRWFERVTREPTWGGMLHRVGLRPQHPGGQDHYVAIARVVRRAVGPDHYRMWRCERLLVESAEILDEPFQFVGSEPAGRPAFEGDEVDVRRRTPLRRIRDGSALAGRGSASPGRVGGRRRRGGAWPSPSWLTMANPMMTRRAGRA